MKKTLLIVLAMSGLTCFSQNGTSDPFIDNIIKNPNLPGLTDFNDGLYIPNAGNYNGNAPNTTTVQQQNAYVMQQVEREFAQRQQQERQFMARDLLTNGFSSFAGEDSVGTSYFHNAFAEIDNMYYQNVLIHAAELVDKRNLQSFGDMQPLANKILDQLEVYYKAIDDLGYEETPDIIYENWLQYVEQQKLASDKNRTIILNEIR